MQAEAEFQVAEQREKEGRAKKTIDKAQRQLRSKLAVADASVSSSSVGVSGATAHEKDIQLSELREVTRTMLQELRVLALQNPGKRM